MAYCAPVEAHLGAPGAVDGVGQKFVMQQRIATTFSFGSTGVVAQKRVLLGLGLVFRRAQRCGRDNLGVPTACGSYLL